MDRLVLIFISSITCLMNFLVNDVHLIGINHYISVHFIASKYNISNKRCRASLNVDSCISLAIASLETLFN